MFKYSELGIILNCTQHLDLFEYLHKLFLHWIYIEFVKSRSFVFNPGEIYVHLWWMGE
jgi:hypothetical protein